MSVAGFIVAFPMLSAKADSAEVPTSIENRFALPSLKFPLVPSTLTSGFMNGARYVEPIIGVKPVALIGTENLSWDWLQVNREYFKEHSVTILVVSVSSGESFDRLIGEFGELSIIPMPGDRQIAEELLISVYPVLIDIAGGVIRQ